MTIEGTGALGLLPLLKEHVLATIDVGNEEQTPDHGQTPLSLLTQGVRFGERPAPGELLDKAKAAQPEGFKRWTARAVAPRGDHGDCEVGIWIEDAVSGPIAPGDPQ